MQQFVLTLWIDGKPYECKADGAMEALEMALALCKHVTRSEMRQDAAYKIMHAIVQLVEGGKDAQVNLGYGHGIVQLTYKA